MTRPTHDVRAIAHDLNNLLTVILGQSDRLDEEARSLTAACRGIEAAAARGVALVRRLLDPVVEERATFDAVQVTRTVEGALRCLLNPNGRLILDLSATPLWIRGAPGDLELVLSNLVANAAAALEHPGFVRVRLRARDEWVLLDVEDSGAGLTLEDVERIFEPGYSTRPGGTGLGLGLVREVVEQLGGRVGLDPQAPITRFRVRLPRVGPS